MDPVSILSIASATVNIGVRCGSVIHSLYNVIERFRAAELSILSLIEECSTVQLAWEQIHDWVETELAGQPANRTVLERIQRSLYAGEVVLAALQEDVGAALEVPVKSGFLQRTKVLWKEEALKEHQFRIRGQVAALTLLLQVIHLPRPVEQKHLLTVKARVFDDSDASAYSIVPSIRAGSITSTTTTSTEASQDIRYVPFDFEDSLFTSWVYKRNFRTPLVEQVPSSRLSFSRNRGESSRSGHAQSVVASSSGSSGAPSLYTDSGASSSRLERQPSLAASTLTSDPETTSLASPITPASADTSEQTEKLTKLFEVMVH
ncbi:putative ankyrin repeat protein [Diplodia seriata]|uniref:Putative ankyrin repeat protein n=1 Tax=Diplodia seriata TaxID=420778 RepID=A0A0G2EZ88_9PEZI|nr:putative ankyrin repeat protein [Diplodia seriata]